MKITTFICFSVMSSFCVTAQEITRDALHSSTNFGTAHIRHTIGQLIAPSSNSSFLYGYQAPILLQTIRDSAPDIHIYPNPVTSVLHVTTPKKEYYYRLSTLAGQLIRKGNLTNFENIILMEELPKGVFVFTLFNTSKEVVKELKVLKR